MILLCCVDDEVVTSGTIKSNSFADSANSSKGKNILLGITCFNGMRQFSLELHN